MAARRYAVLQPFIIDKSALYEEMVRLPGKAGTEPGCVVELGVGTGGFLEWLARSGQWPNARLTGADLCEARLAVARETLAGLGREAVLRSGVNALDGGSRFYVDEAPGGAADVVVLSQFEHYAPNDRTSALARRLSTGDRAWCPKSELRRLALSRLRPGGWLFVIDDYAAASIAEQTAWDQAWDAHVVRAFAGEAARDAVAVVDPAAAIALARRYHAARPLAQRLALAARARARRRHRDAEEVQELGVARADFRALCGDRASGVVAHPEASSHPQFFLLWGRRGGEGLRGD